MVLLLTACNRDKVKVYYAPKENSGTDMTAAGNGNDMMNGSLPAGHPSFENTGQPQVNWKTPDGWKEQPASEFRLGSFNISGENGKQADVSIVPLPGDAGGDVPNVNRWRGQVGLTSLSDEELQKTAQSIDVGGQPGQMYEEIGTNPGSDEPMGILAVIQHRDGIAWFFKMTGDPGVIANQKPTFVEFLKTLKFEAAQPGAMPSMTGGNLPSGHPDISMMPAPADGPISHEGQPSWQVPANWKEVSGGQFLIAKFLINGEENAQAAVNVSSSVGDGGGLVANVNRWRRQLGLGETSAEDISKSVSSVSLTEGKADLIELNGMDARSGQPARLVAIIVPHMGQTWFYKLMGDSKVVENQKDAFTQFVKSAKY